MTAGIVVNTFARALTLSAAALVAVVACTGRDALRTDAGQPLAEVAADNAPATALFGPQGEAHLLVRVGYDANANAKLEPAEPLLSGWGLRVTRVDDAGGALEPSRVLLTPAPNGKRWNGLLLKLPSGRYAVQTLDPTGEGAGTAWKATGDSADTVTLESAATVPVLEFSRVCLENDSAVDAPRLAAVCKPKFDLAPRINAFNAAPGEVRPGGRATFTWEVPDSATLEIDEGVGPVTAANGSLEVEVFDTARYTLTARNAFGASQAQTIVTAKRPSLRGTFTRGPNLPAGLSSFVAPVPLDNGKVAFFRPVSGLEGPVQVQTNSFYLFDPRSNAFAKVSVPDGIKEGNGYVVPLKQGRLLIRKYIEHDPGKRDANGNPILELAFFVLDTDKGQYRRLAAFDRLKCYVGLFYENGKVICADGFFGEGGTYRTRFAIHDFERETSLQNAPLTQTGILMSEGDPNIVHLKLAANRFVSASRDAIEIYDFDRNTARIVTARPAYRYRVTATRLSDTQVLLSGGLDAQWRLVNATPEVFDLETERLTSVGPMVQNRSRALAFPLPDGNVLFLGGYAQVGADAWEHARTAEVYDRTAGRFAATGAMLEERVGFGAIQLKDGRVLVYGGLAENGSAVLSTEFYNP